MARFALLAATLLIPADGRRGDRDPLRRLTLPAGGERTPRHTRQNGKMCR